MRSSAEQSMLDSVKAIRLGVPRLDRVENAAQTLYWFRLKHRSHFKLQLRGLTANADVELIQDRDRDQRLDAGEVVASSRALGWKAESMNIEGLERGIYYVRVFSKEDGSTAYKLTLTASPTTKVSSTYEVVLQTNRLRSKAGLLPLAVNTQLTAAAQRYAREMAIKDNFSHTGSDGSSPWDRIQRSGYDYSEAAENLAAGHTTVASVMKGWFNSSGHRYNMLAYQVQEIGVGYHYLKDDKGTFTYQHYWSQSLGTPADVKVVPNVPEGISKD